MDSEVSKFDKENGKIVFSFDGFNEWEDYASIVQIVAGKIRPEKMDYSGFEDIVGYFEKDKIHIDLIYDAMIGNYCEYNRERYTDIENKKVNGWMEEIYDELKVKNQSNINIVK